MIFVDELKERAGEVVEDLRERIADGFFMYSPVIGVVLTILSIPLHIAGEAIFGKPKSETPVINREPYARTREAARPE